MTYPEALEILRSLGPELRTGKAAGGQPRKFLLDHIRTLLRALGEPQKGFRSVLIAGTNGKGSTAATLATITAAAGVRTGLYTSPHLLRVNERMRVSMQTHEASGTSLLAEIDDDKFGHFFGLAYTTAAALVDRAELPHKPSFFELLTAAAFLYFAEQRVELAVLEVGLGGRLDATNVVEPIVSVITDIGLDHTEFLGDTIAAIAAEKAGILRPEGVLVTLAQHPEANAAIGERAIALSVRGVDASRCLPPRGFVGWEQEVGSRGRSSEPGTGGMEPRTPSTEPIGQERLIAEHLAGTGVAETVAFNRNELEGPAPVAHAGIPAAIERLADRQPSPLGRNRYPLSIDGEVIQVDSPLAGHHQQRNVALAVAAALELRANHGFSISNAAIGEGVRATVWPGRLEWLPHPAHAYAPLLLDVAHNPAGAWALRAALSQLDERRSRTLLFSCMADKQLDEMARILFPLFDATSGDPARRRDHIVLAPIDNPRAASVQDLLDVAHHLDVPVHAAPHLPGALNQARSLTPLDGIIVVTGSVYLVGAVRELVVADADAVSR